MVRKLEYIIPTTKNNITVGNFLKEMGYSHSVIVQLKKTAKSITSDGTWLYINDHLLAGQHLSITLPEEHSSENIVPVNLPLSIVYEDADILVLNKPANMPVHPSLNNYENTLANAVAWYFKEQDIPFTFRCMNRLDRDTTGLTVLAKHMLSGCILSGEIQNRTVHREYLAIVQGKLTGTGTIDAPIARKDDSVIERIVDFGKGERAVTHYACIDYNSTNDLSLVSIHLETGRTHQIRVHMKSIGHPLIGDFLYNPDYTFMNRQSLHSAKLTFVHPITKKEQCFTAPLPYDMQRLFPEYTV